jgi:hypothetical protein
MPPLACREANEIPRTNAAMSSISAGTTGSAGSEQEACCRAGSAATAF